MFLSLDVYRELPTIGRYRLRLYRDATVHATAVAILTPPPGDGVGMDELAEIANDALSGHRLSPDATLFVTASVSDGVEYFGELTFRTVGRRLIEPQLGGLSRQAVEALIDATLPPLT